MFNLFHKHIYADTAAATPVSARVMKAMHPYMAEVFYNPSSLYPAAQKSKVAVEKARKDIAELLSVQPHTIVFTSGGTESAHLAILGTISKAKEKGLQLPNVVSSTFEHPALLELLQKLVEKKEITLSWVFPNSDGLVTVQGTLDAIKPETALVCLMAVNNEIGTIQPVRKISSEVKKKRQKDDVQFPYVYTDAAQAPQALGINRDQLGADLISFDSAKIYGPKGVGCLYIESHVEINAIQLGGGQERGLRAGTEPVPLIVGFAEAMKETIEIQSEQKKLHSEIQRYFLKKLEELIDENENNKKNNIQYEINGSIKEDERTPQNLNVCFKKNGKPVNSEFLTIQLGEKGIMVSPGASCASNKTTSVSQSIEAIGKPECASSSIRFTFGRDVSKKDIDYIVKTLIETL